MTARSPWRLRWRDAIAVAWAPLVVFGAHVGLDGGLNAYDARPWLDGPMHLAGGLAMAHAIRTALRIEGCARAATGPILAALVVTGTATAAILWEFAEFGADQLMGTNLQVSLPNTMKDLAFGLLGAVVVAAVPWGSSPHV